MSNDDNECTICLENIENNFTTSFSKKPITLPCGHIFHNKCIGVWLLDKNRCPICRQIVKKRFRVNMDLKNKNICDFTFYNYFFGIKEFGMEEYKLPYSNYSIQEYNSNLFLFKNRSKNKNYQKIRNLGKKTKYEFSLSFENKNDVVKFKEILFSVFYKSGLV